MCNGRVSCPRPTTRTDASGKVETTTYDQKANVTNHTNRKGQATSMTFDEMDRPITSTYADGSRITNTYDTLGRLVKLVRSSTGTLAEPLSTNSTPLTACNNSPAPQGQLPPQ